jgi:hypothetical protein
MDCKKGDIQIMFMEADWNIRGCDSDVSTFFVQTL